MGRNTWTTGLSKSERRFLVAMNQLGFGRFERLQIKRGELVLDPWPASVRGVRFGSERSPTDKGLEDDFELKLAAVQFFEYVRAAGEGEILSLEVRRGIPASMEIMHHPAEAEPPKSERR